MSKKPVTQDHELKETLTVDYNTPGHDPRGAATLLFTRTRLELIERERGRCWLTGMTAAESGAPLEAHHYPVERSFAEGWDWPRFAKDCQAGRFGPYAKSFDWVAFFVGSQTIQREDTGKPFVKVVDPYLFVDDMRVNGMLLAKKFHTGPDEGKHTLPDPVWLAQGYLAEGFKFSDFEVVHHSQEIEESPIPVVMDVGNGDPPPPPPPSK